jgi:pimeloyl-ACP methyl ester carboxylesterase
VRLLVVLSVVACAQPPPVVIEPVASPVPPPIELPALPLPPELAELPSAPPAAVDELALAPLPAEVEAQVPYLPTAFTVQVHGHGRPIILIPGVGCPGSVWDDAVAHFSDAETHVLTLAGFAGQPSINGPINATARSELARYIRDRKLDHPVIIGHSMGGFLAFWLAVTEPDLVGPIIIVDAAPQIDGEPRPEPEARAAVEPWRSASDAEFGSRMREMFARMANDKAKIAPLLDVVARSDKRVFADALVEMATVDIRPDLAKITQPVLLILADTPPYPELVARQVQPIPHKQLVVLPRTQHFVFFDDPAGFFRTVDRFLAEHPIVASPRD